MAKFFLLSLASVVALATNAPQRPCDILAAAGNPCVAAHSTTRALFAAYSGGLYNVTRASDGATLSVPVLGPGGFANKAAHDAFCPKLDCVISFVLDQSGNGNDLGQRHKLVNASQHPITAGGVPVYGMWFDPGYGYHVDATNKVAKDNEPESIFAVFSGKHFNGGCCFDYGNSESNNKDDGDGTMEALYFGNAHWRGNSGSGTGPWVGADLEQGMYYGGGLNQTVKNMQNTPLTSDFVTAYLRGGTDGFMLKGGDATQGTLTTVRGGVGAISAGGNSPFLTAPPPPPPPPRRCTTARAPLSRPMATTRRDGSTSPQKSRAPSSLRRAATIQTLRWVAFTRASWCLELPQTPLTRRCRRTSWLWATRAGHPLPKGKLSAPRKNRAITFLFSLSLSPPTR